MKQIVLIGLGGIGFRHFQSLITEKKYKITLFAVDVSDEAITKAKEWEQSNINNQIDVIYKNDVAEIKGNIDIAIIATSSLVRRKVFEQLVEKAKVEYVVFEKFLFPRLLDYDEVKDILHRKDIKAYVNCPCRLYPGYIELKKKLKDNNRIDAILTGSNWGMACNAIHTIDVLGYLLDTYDELKVDAILIDDEISETKRKGYVEFTGRLICSIAEKANILFDSDKTGVNAFKLTIFSENSVFTVFETDQKMIISSKGDSKVYEFPIFYQSQLTVQVVEELIEKGDCGLTLYDNTIQWHKALLMAFLEKYNKIEGKKTDTCPIT